jgi:hypothetical protein
MTRTAHRDIPLNTYHDPMLILVSLILEAFCIPITYTKDNNSHVRSRSVLKVREDAIT